MNHVLLRIGHLYFCKPPILRSPKTVLPIISAMNRIVKLLILTTIPPNMHLLFTFLSSIPLGILLSHLAQPNLCQPGCLYFQITSESQKRSEKDNSGTQALSQGYPMSSPTKITAINQAAASLAQQIVPEATTDSDQPTT